MRVILSSAALMLSAAAAAEEFDYEVFAGFDGSNSESQTVATPGGLDFPLVLSQSDVESDTYSAGFRWYLDGLSDDLGPRDQAAFTDRASFAEFAVLSTSLSTSGTFRIGDEIAPLNGDLDQTAIALGGRKVFENWFLTGSLSYFDSDNVGPNLEQMLVTAGIGRYIGETTAMSLSAIRVSTESGSFNDVDSGVQLDFNHVGDVVGSDWQYAVDLAASNESFENSDGQYRAGLTLYPTKNFGFGLTVEDQIGDSDNDAVRWTLGANWFVTPHLQFEFAAGSTTFDEPEGVDIDSNQYSIQARYRF